MKRIVLSCMMAAACSLAMAQNQQTPAQAKAAFEAKVVELNNALVHNNQDLGKTILQDLNHKMTVELGVTKTAIATGATQAVKDAETAKIRNQSTYYSHIMSLANDNIVTHRVEINDELDHFAATY